MFPLRLDPLLYHYEGENASSTFANKDHLLVVFNLVWVAGSYAIRQTETSHTLVSDDM